jgi:hypothetical protein
MSKDGVPLGAAAAKAGMCDRTARKYVRLAQLPSQMKQPRHWRTREDPFAEVWPELEGLLGQAPELQALTLFEELERRYPGRFAEGQLRTLRRRVRVWRGLYGPDRDVIFPQVHRPGFQSQSDFTWMNSLEVTLAGTAFPHLLYHFVLCYSNWEYVEICPSESYESLSSGLQNALWTLGAVPDEHRSDNLSAATFGYKGRREFTDSYLALVGHYDMRATKIQPGEAHENGDVEQAHYRLKERVDQALQLRGSRDFADRPGYEEFLRQQFGLRNLARRKRLAEELAVMKALPARRLDDYREFKVPVNSWSTIQVAHKTYSVPSRLMRQEVVARLYGQRVEVYFAGQLIQSMERLRGQGKARIDYRHVIGSLIRKPGAFERYRFREEMFPSTVFRQAYDQLLSADRVHAVRRYLEILHWVAQNSESGMEGALRQCLDAGQELDFDRLVEMTADPRPESVDIQIPLPNMAAYDALLREVTL